VGGAQVDNQPAAHGGAIDRGKGSGHGPQQFGQSPQTLL